MTVQVDQLAGIPMRDEQAIFDDLAELCSSPGYVHALAYLCFRDSMIQFSGPLTPDQMQKSLPSERLIRTETSTLAGLLAKNKISYDLPDPGVTQGYIDQTEKLLGEMHEAMVAVYWDGISADDLATGKVNPFENASVLREPIFYGGESAYSFQYRDFSVRKYQRDDEWLKLNKGFVIQAARDVAHAVGRVLDENAQASLTAMKRRPMDEWTFLPGTMFTAEQVAREARMDVATVTCVLDAFSMPQNERNAQFKALHDFNAFNAFPLLRAGEAYVLFHIYSLVEALYESPFYWMNADASYAGTAMQHRGKFTEGFAVDRLAQVFGPENVHANVHIQESKGKEVGEIDVLVLFGNRAVVLQAKSKRLTQEARRGNDGQLKDDFQKSIQDSCDQAYRCATALANPAYRLVTAQGATIAVPPHLKKTYALCVVSDHYPALSFQARQFLKFQPVDGVASPFVMDVFALDAIVEMLESPLRVLSYVDRRTGYHDRLMASHEMTILSYHLKQNLWVDEGHDMVMLADDISTDLDVAMLVRREGLPGSPTPEGILTRLQSTALGRMVAEIERSPEPGTTDLGFMLLTLSEATFVEVSSAIGRLLALARADGKGHDLTVGLGKGSVGLTIHCNSASVQVAGPDLERHCLARKYTERAREWFGVCIQPSDGSLRFGINFDFAWERSAEMDALTRRLPADIGKGQRRVTTGAPKPAVGRNDPCCCGSGKKYKKCCLNAQ